MADNPRPSSERRQTIISDNDIERIGEAFDRKIQGLFEMIGYDTSTPDSRGEIRKDHEFVRDARKAKAVALTTFFTAIIGSVAAWVYSVFAKT